MGEVRLGAATGKRGVSSARPAMKLRSAINEGRLGGALLMGADGSGRRVCLESALSDLDQNLPIIHLNGSEHAAHMRHGVLSFILAQLNTTQIDSRHELVHGLAQLLCKDGQRTLVVLGSPDLIDSESAAILAQLAAMNKIFLVVICERLAELPSDLLAIHRSERLIRVSVRTMDLRETREYLEGELGGPISMFAASALWSLTRSNRDLLHLLLRDMVADGKLTLVEGSWVFAPGALSIGPSIKAKTSRTFSGLDAQQHNLLIALAEGGVIDVDTVRRHGQADALVGLRVRGLVDVGEEPRGEVKIRVPLLAHLLRDRVRGEDADGQGALMSQLHPDPRAAYVLTEATAMLELGNFEALVAVVDEYIGNGGGGPDSWIQDPRCQMAILKAEIDASMMLGRHGRAGQGIVRASEGISEAIRRAPEDPRFIEAAQMMRLINARMLIVDGRAEVVEATLQDQGVIGGAPRSLPGHQDTPVPGVETTDAAPSLWASEALQFKAMAIQAEAWALSTKPAAGLELARRIKADIQGLRLTGVLDQVLSEEESAEIECALLRVQLLAGAWKDAARTARRLRKGHYGDPRTVAFGETVVGLLAALSNESDVALGSLLPTLHQLSATTGSSQRISAEAAVGYCLADQDEEAESMELLLRAQTVLERTIPLNFFTWVAEAFSALTITSLGISGNASSRMTAMAERARAAGRPALEMNSLAMALRLGERDVAGRLVEVATLVKGPVGDAFALLGRSVSTGSWAQLADALELLVALGHPIYAMDPDNSLLEMLGHKERRRVIAAVARLRHTGKPNQVSDQNAGGDEEPIWLAELTNRERQIARQVISGMSNAAIARKTGVSVRTVEGHLYQVYSKLQVRSRQELSDLDRTWRPVVLAR